MADRRRQQRDRSGPAEMSGQNQIGDHPGHDLALAGWACTGPDHPARGRRGGRHGKAPRLGSADSKGLGRRDTDVQQGGQVGHGRRIGASRLFGHAAPRPVQAPGRPGIVARPGQVLEITAADRACRIRKAPRTGASSRTT
nr:hypothetical protein [Microvirga arsenatis]